MEKKIDKCLILLSKRGRAVVIIIVAIGPSASGRGQRPRCRGASALQRSQRGRIRGFIAGPYCAVQPAAQHCYAAVQHKCCTVYLFPIQAVPLSICLGTVGASIVQVSVYQFNYHFRKPSIPKPYLYTREYPVFFNYSYKLYYYQYFYYLTQRT